MLVCNADDPPQHLVFYTAEGHKSDEILALNPRGQVSTVTKALRCSSGCSRCQIHTATSLTPCLQVPTYKEGFTIINESMAIVQWLEVAHPEKSLTPKGKEAEVTHWLTSPQGVHLLKWHAAQPP